MNQAWSSFFYWGWSCLASTLTGWLWCIWYWEKLQDHITRQGENSQSIQDYSYTGFLTQGWMGSRWLLGVNKKTFHGQSALDIPQLAALTQPLGRCFCCHCTIVEGLFRLDDLLVPSGLNLWIQWEDLLSLVYHISPVTPVLSPIICLADASFRKASI